jgi:tRNA(Ile)-lysidine synthase
VSQLEARFDRVLSRLALPAGPAWVAVSGGPDSLALLLLLARSEAARHLGLVVAHLDHGIHPESGAVAEQVEAVARNLGLPFRSTRLALGEGASETRAREGRYRWLLQAARDEGALLLTAHNRDDQVETVLMRFLEGSGLAGLAGMPFTARPRAGGEAATGIVRPLLGFDRLELRGWLREQGVTAWEDPSNLDARHLRGWLRSALLPVLESRQPAARDRVLRVAEAARLNRAAWEELLAVLPIDVREVSHGISVASAPLRGYDFPLALSLVITLARQVRLSLGPRRAARVVGLLRQARVGARLELGQGWIAELSRDRLAVVRIPPVAAETTIEGGAGELAWGTWQVRWGPAPGGQPVRRDAWTASVVPARYQLTGWRLGDRIRPFGGAGSRLVVRCMQDVGVPRHQRPGWPVLRQGGVVVWVPGVCRSDAVVPGDGMEAMRIDVTYT